MSDVESNFSHEKPQVAGSLIVDLESLMIMWFNWEELECSLENAKPPRPKGNMLSNLDPELKLSLSRAKISKFHLPELNLPDNEVHVWQVALEQPTDIVNQFARMLLPDELARVKRFHFVQDQRRFIVSHVALRIIIGEYLHIVPNEIHFSYSAAGKPYLVDNIGKIPLRFNMAHSHELAICGFAHEREIGIDLEYIRPLADVEEIADRFFSSREKRELHSLPEDLKLKAFYDCWTRKEAYLKATGTGLSQALDTFDVSLLPGMEAMLRYVEGVQSDVTRWSMVALAPSPEYVAALVVNGHGWCIKCWKWHVV